MNTVLTSPTHDGAFKPAPWLGKLRPCLHCRAVILKRRGDSVDVRHEPRCQALRG